jgi:DNA (cytosine-5)-methyltransferase 1
VLDEARWGGYAAAVARWELLVGRPVPEPTQPGMHGRPVLAPPFVEWLMGPPVGWVTDRDLGLPRTAALRVLGNGVVPQQAAAALRLPLCPHRWAGERAATAVTR